MIEGMRQYIGKQVPMADCEIIINDAYTCYEGDFFRIEYLSGANKGNSVDINIWSEAGTELTNCLSYLKNGLANSQSEE